MVKVFLADDSSIIRLRLVALLCELAWVDIVGKGQSGLDAIEGTLAFEPDVLILAMPMPEGSGFDALKRIKQHADAPIVIVLTNHPEFRQSCLDAGADFFLDKSIEFDQVPGILAQINQINDSFP
jgi:DNA-binding NarL/FixJ family response regulator